MPVEIEEDTVLGQCVVPLLKGFVQANINSDARIAKGAKLIKHLLPNLGLNSCEVPALLSHRLVERGRDASQVSRAVDDLDGLERALALAASGDVVVFTPLVDTAGVFGRLRAAGFSVD